MDPAIPFDWHRMFIGNEPPLFFLEIVFRIVAIYLFAAVLLRFMGKRGQGQLSPFEFVVVIALGSATGDAMFYPEVPILYAWAVIAVVVLLSVGLSKAQLYSARVNAFLEGEPRPLVWRGQVLHENVARENLRPDEFRAMLREQGLGRTDDLAFAFLERSGRLGYHRDPNAAPGPALTTLPDDLADPATPGTPS